MTDPAAFALGYLLATAQLSRSRDQWKDLAITLRQQGEEWVKLTRQQRENLLTQDLLIDDLRQRVAQLEAILELVEGSDAAV